jgi:hypothetical protein
MQKRLPLILSATAVVIALLGSTSVGQAASKAVGQTVHNARSAAGLAPAAAQPRRGPRGPRGRRGPRGPVGPAGTAVAYAHVFATGSFDTAKTKNAGVVIHPLVGRYCLSGLPVTPQNAVVTIGQDGYAIGVDVRVGSYSPTGGCTPGTQIEVRTFDESGYFADNDFMINVN